MKRPIRSSKSKEMKRKSPGLVDSSGWEGEPQMQHAKICSLGRATRRHRLMLEPVPACCPTSTPRLCSRRDMDRRGWRRRGGRCWCKSRPKGSSTQQYSSPLKGQRTKEPLRRTAPSSTTTTSTTTTAISSTSTTTALLQSRR
jgi:hypothetical protein